MTKQRTRRADAAETADDAAPPDPTYPVQLPAKPGVTVHYSKISGRHTAVIDQGITASALTAALARYLPGDVPLVETVTHVGAAMLIFQGAPDPRESDAPGDGEAT